MNTDILIELRNLTRLYGDLAAVNQVSFSVPRGQILGYLGPNGAGKTTTVKMLTGIIHPTDGSARICGFDIQKDSLEVKRRIGYVPESGAVYQSLSPLEYLMVIGRLYHIPDQAISRRIDEFATFFQIGDHLSMRMTGFSKGMKQKVVIAAALLHNPEVLFLDEPLNGLDANTALQIKKLLRELSAAGKTIFYCSHILDVVENLCDRVIIVNKGRVTADGSVKNLKEMTQRSSLEDVFADLTLEGDQTEMIRAISSQLVLPKRDTGDEQP